MKIRKKAELMETFFSSQFFFELAEQQLQCATRPNAMLFNNFF